MVDEADLEFVREFFKSKRNIWNAKHSIHVKGFEVEVYPQDSAEDHVSSGVYSVRQGRWLIEPQRKVIDHDISAEAVVHKAIEFQHAIDNANDYSELDRLVDKIWKMRKAGLNKEGEFSEENLIFKHLRNTGYLGKLLQFKTDKQDQELSLAEQRLLNEDKRGNIMRILGLPKFVADYYHEKVGPKWSFTFARWWKEEWGNASSDHRVGGTYLESLERRLRTIKGQSLQTIWLEAIPEDYHLNFVEEEWKEIVNYISEHPESYKQLKNLSIRDALSFVHKKQAKSLSKNKDNIVMTFNDGFFWYNTRSNVCPEWMKNQMQHCGRDLRGELVFLVDPNNDLHGTLTWDREDETIVQAVGKQNEMPEEKYWKYFSEFVNQQKAPPSQDMFMLSLEKFGNWLWDRMPEELQKPIKHTDETGITTYKMKGKLHREDGPAKIWSPGREEWRINGKLHREDGPALTFGRNAGYYLNGNAMILNQWKLEVFRLQGRREREN